MGNRNKEMVEDKDFVAELRALGVSQELVEYLQNEKIDKATLLNYSQDEIDEDFGELGDEVKALYQKLKPLMPTKDINISATVPLPRSLPTADISLLPPNRVGDSSAVPLNVTSNINVGLDKQPEVKYYLTPQEDIQNLLIVRGTSDSTVIGRDPKYRNLSKRSFTIDHPTVSKIHSQLKVIDDRLFLTDLKSTKGTYVSVRSRQQLENEDFLWIGSTGFKVHIGNDQITLSVVESFSKFVKLPIADKVFSRSFSIGKNGDVSIQNDPRFTYSIATIQSGARNEWFIEVNKSPNGIPDVYRRLPAETDVEIRADDFIRFGALTFRISNLYRPFYDI
eukprot:TRINITY_DN14124_c0_g1_i2.p1 TRINITY_DN14124_c0_g1~~TRINITY_DN14124_c0_g1_i2.p1  ORF type:complete len:336 (+),score=38.66 TRINITY_DN14124_c0_g1_i2:97-1104(+)